MLTGKRTGLARPQSAAVLPSMGAVTAYALSWEANKQTLAQCQAEAQRETGGMVELVALANDASLTFPNSAENRATADKRDKEPVTTRWFNPMLPLWKRVRELEAEGYRLLSVQCAGPEHSVSQVVLALQGREGTEDLG